MAVLLARADSVDDALATTQDMLNDFVVVVK
jgi:hypothetical protein